MPAGNLYNAAQCGDYVLWGRAKLCVCRNVLVPAGAADACAPRGAALSRIQHQDACSTTQRSTNAAQHEFHVPCIAYGVVQHITCIGRYKLMRERIPTRHAGPPSRFSTRMPARQHNAAQHNAAQRNAAAHDTAQHNAGPPSRALSIRMPAGHQDKASQHITAQYNAAHQHNAAQHADRVRVQKGICWKESRYLRATLGCPHAHSAPGCLQRTSTTQQKCSAAQCSGTQCSEAQCRATLTCIEHQDACSAMQRSTKQLSTMQGRPHAHSATRMPARQHKSKVA
jgi:hypothetical protein